MTAIRLHLRSTDDSGMRARNIIALLGFVGDPADIKVSTDDLAMVLQHYRDLDDEARR